MCRAVRGGSVGGGERGEDHVGHQRQECEHHERGQDEEALRQTHRPHPRQNGW